MRGTQVLGVIAFMAVIASLPATTGARQPAATQPKPATEATKAANRAVRQSLNFEEVTIEGGA